MRTPGNQKMGYGNTLTSLCTLVLPISSLSVVHYFVSLCTSGAKDKFQEFVTDGFNSKILPLPVSLIEHVLVSLKLNKIL